MAWQQEWVEQAESNRVNACFRQRVTFKDGSEDNGVFQFGNPLTRYALDFSGYDFTEYFQMENYEFLCDVIFTATTFSQQANFVNVRFFGQVRFTNARFEHWAVFDGTQFSSSVCFRKAYFNHASFRNLTFLSKALTRFNNALFNGQLNFNDTKCYARVHFEGVNFLKGGIFRNSHFDHLVDFYKTVFFDYCRFTDAVFVGKARFEKVRFIGNAWFNKVKFGNDVSFHEAEFQAITDINSTNFNEMANFENVQFNNVGHFEGVAFLKKIPSFRGCQKDKTYLDFSDLSFFTSDDFSEEAIKNISFLKRLSDEHGQVDQALNFNAMELRAKRKNTCQKLSPDNHQDAKHEQLKTHFSWRCWVWLTNIFKGDFWFWLFTLLYEKCSDFGRSFTRPLFLLAIVLAFSFILAGVSAYITSPAKLTYSRQSIFTELSRVYIYPQKSTENKYIPISAYRAAMEYSLYRSGNFLDFTDADKNTSSINMRLFGSEIEPWWARFFGFIKGILTAILLFLIALGLRNKYRVS